MNSKYNQNTINSISAHKPSENLASAKNIFEHAIAAMISRNEPITGSIVKILWNKARKSADLAGELSQGLYQEKGRYW